MSTESQHFSTKANGGITNTPIIFTQNSNIQLKYWLADAARVTGSVADNHALGLWGLTCERAGETLAEPGIHTMMPTGLDGAGAYLAGKQQEAANHLIALASKETNSPASDWIVREFVLDDDDVGPLTKNDLTGIAASALYAVLGSGWQADMDGFAATAWESILTDTSVPDNTFMALIGGFEAPHGALLDVDQIHSGPACGAWAVTRGASTVGFYPVEMVGSWVDNWGWVVDKPIYFKQNESMNIYIIRSAATGNSMDTTLGLNILVCERIGENISAAKISN
jgi:hypothetical protein